MSFPCRRQIRAGFVIIAAVTMLAGCHREQRPARASRPQAQKRIVRSLAFPFGTDAVAPALASDADGALLVSWIDKRARSLDVARWRDGRWFQPRTIVRAPIEISRENMPSLLAGRDFVVAQWIEENGKGTAVRISRSNDGGATWSEPVTPHPAVESEFGFGSLVEEKGGNAGVVWLDGRELEGGEEGHGDMQLRYATIDAQGRASADELLDARVCDCCQTSIAMTADGPVVVFRDRSPDEIRDIAVIRRGDNGWTKAKPVRREGWKIFGCPVNGPRVVAAGLNVVTAWFSAANHQPHVSVAFSSDGGVTFGNPIRVDSGHAAGRVDLVMLADGSAVVTWMEGDANGAVINAAKVARDGTRGPIIPVGRALSVSSAGFPRVAISKDNVVVAWSGEAAGMQLVLLHIPDL